MYKAKSTTLILNTKIEKMKNKKQLHDIIYSHILNYCNKYQTNSSPTKQFINIIEIIN